MPDKFQLLNVVSDEIDYDEIKKEIRQIHKDNADLFSFYESPAGELYLRLVSPERIKNSDDVLFKLKEMIERKVARSS